MTSPGKLILYKTPLGLAGVIQIDDLPSYGITDWARNKDTGVVHFVATDGEGNRSRAGLSIENGAGWLSLNTIQYDVSEWRKAADGVILFSVVDPFWAAVDQMATKVMSG